MTPPDHPKDPLNSFFFELLKEISSCGSPVQMWGQLWLTCADVAERSALLPSAAPQRGAGHTDGNPTLNQTDNWVLKRGEHRSWLMFKTFGSPWQTLAHSAQSWRRSGVAAPAQPHRHRDSQVPPLPSVTPLSPPSLARGH